MGRTQLNIRMDAEEKEEWDEYREQARWADSLTDFVKTAVREKIERMDSEGGDFEVPEVDASGGGVANSGEVLERIQDLRNDMQDLESEVSGAVDAVHAQQGVDPDLAPELYQALPVGEEDAMTAEDLAHKTGHKEAAVRFALENLRRSDGLGVTNVVEVEDQRGNVTTSVG
ncbi:hypothetical protein SY89_00696 [Halolamina pelagica]|uniref:Uncharacterized protein n=2 Tax=Halolamina pelagica TaxID=699431 RepID=A0A0P7GWS0_9EURY|nr:hypothetical protein SY89_00696 [Halolamina pelagica]